MRTTPCALPATGGTNRAATRGHAWIGLLLLLLSAPAAAQEPISPSVRFHAPITPAPKPERVDVELPRMHLSDLIGERTLDLGLVKLDGRTGSITIDKGIASAELNAETGATDLHVKAKSLRVGMAVDENQERVVYISAEALGRTYRVEFVVPPGAVVSGSQAILATGRLPETTTRVVELRDGEIVREWSWQVEEQVVFDVPDPRTRQRTARPQQRPTRPPDVRARPRDVRRREVRPRQVRRREARSRPQRRTTPTPKPAARPEAKRTRTAYRANDPRRGTALSLYRTLRDAAEAGGPANAHVVAQIGSALEQSRLQEALNHTERRALENARREAEREVERWAREVAGPARARAQQQRRAKQIESQRRPEAAAQSRQPAAPVRAPAARLEPTRGEARFLLDRLRLDGSKHDTFEQHRLVSFAGSTLTQPEFRRHYTAAEAAQVVERVRELARTTPHDQLRAKAQEALRKLDAAPPARSAPPPARQPAPAPAPPPSRGQPKPAPTFQACPPARGG